MSNIVVSVHFDALRIKVDGRLHLHVSRSKLLGVQSWVMNESRKYCIEYTLKGGSLLTEYDDATKFNAILQQLEAFL